MECVIFSAAKILILENNLNEIICQRGLWLQGKSRASVCWGKTMLFANHVFVWSHGSEGAWSG